MLTELDHGVFVMVVNVDTGPFGGKLHVKQNKTIRK